MVVPRFTTRAEVGQGKTLMSIPRITFCKPYSGDPKGTLRHTASDQDMHCLPIYVTQKGRNAYMSEVPNMTKYSKTCVKRPLSKDKKMVFKTDYCLMQVKSIAQCSKESLLQYFRPSLSYQLSLRSLFFIFLNGRFTQVLL